MGEQPTAHSDHGARAKTSARTGPALMTAEDARARMNADKARETSAYALGVQAAIWGMQWVRGAQAFRRAAEPLRAGETPSLLEARPHGINVWGHARALPTHEGPLAETPNTEMLSSSAVVDLKEGPVVVVHPEFGTRYFRTSLRELHGDTHTISQRQDGAKPPPYALALLDWKGTVPKGVKTIRVRSRYVALATEIGVSGESDIGNVVPLQEGLKLVALRSWAKGDKPVDPGPPMRPLQRPDTRTPSELLFFEELAEALRDFSIRDDELAFARQLERIGLTLGEGFRGDKLDAPSVAGLTRAALDAESVLEHRARALPPAQAGGTWLVAPGEVTSLDDWLHRGATGWRQGWADEPNELVAPIARSDERGEALTGASTYVLQFPKGQLPPARYWRITMYDLDGHLVDNPLKRYGIGNLAEKLQPNPDGSLTVHIQHASPGKAKEVNWLPAPAEGFFLVMRMYQPEQRMCRGDYVVPPVQPVEATEPPSGTPSGTP